jgi:prepilin-type N-terminal cleavage/methylation domain-containing protein
MLAGTQDRAGNMSQPHRTTPARATGFTLIEMMVVIGLVALLAAMALPSIVTLLSAGADAQAYNLIAAQLTFARALAIERVNYAGVHCQIADAKVAGALVRPKQEDVCFTGIVFIDDANANTNGSITTANPNGGNRKFTGYSVPKPVPGGIGLGQVVTAMASGETATVDAATTTACSYTGDAGYKPVFTTFTVVFNANGTVVRSNDATNSGKVEFWDSDPLFKVPTTTSAGDVIGSQQLWDILNANKANNQYGATAIALFEMKRYAPVASATGTSTGPKEYLNGSAQLLPLNTYTGQLYLRE